MQRASAPTGPECDHQSRLIAAYTQKYIEAGRWKAGVWVGSFALFVSGLLTSALGSGQAILGLLAAGYLLCSRAMLRPELIRGDRQGVTLQEQYDVGLFGLDWNEGLAGRRLAQTEVEDLADRFSGDRRLEDWYADGEKAPAGATVLLRQLENATWGRRDHRRFAELAAAALVASIAATVVVGLGTDQLLATYVSALAAPSLPWLLDLSELTILHFWASIKRGGIERDLARAWEQLSNRPAAKARASDLRLFQDRIYAVRLAYGRVPWWFYRLRADRNHRAFRAAAHRMLRDAGWAAGDD